MSLYLFATYSPSPSVRLVENSVSPVSTRTEDVGHERGDNTFPTPYSSLNFLSIVPGGLQKQLMAHQRRCKSHLFSSLLLGLLPAISPLQEYFWVSTEVNAFDMAKISELLELDCPCEFSMIAQTQFLMIWPKYERLDCPYELFMIV